MSVVASISDLNWQISQDFTPTNNFRQNLQNFMIEFGA